MSESLNSVQKIVHAPVAAFNSGDTESGTEVNGLSVDLQPSSGRRYRRCRIMVVGSAANTSGLWWNMGYTVQSATATGGTYADLATSGNFSTVWGAASGTQRGVESAEVDLTSANRYLRVQLTPQAVTSTGANSSATGATLTYAAAVSLFDANRLPASG